MNCPNCRLGMLAKGTDGSQQHYWCAGCGTHATRTGGFRDPTAPKILSPLRRLAALLAGGNLTVVPENEADARELAECLAKLTDALLSQGKAHAG